jgi:hypothetical protein
MCKQSDSVGSIFTDATAVHARRGKSTSSKQAFACRRVCARTRPVLQCERPHIGTSAATRQDLRLPFVALNMKPRSSTRLPPPPPTAHLARPPCYQRARLPPLRTRLRSSECFNTARSLFAARRDDFEAAPVPPYSPWVLFFDSISSHARRASISLASATQRPKELPRHPFTRLNTRREVPDGLPRPLAL